MPSYDHLQPVAVAKFNRRCGSLSRTATSRSAHLPVISKANRKRALSANLRTSNLSEGNIDFAP